MGRWHFANLDWAVDVYGGAAERQSLRGALIQQERDPDFMDPKTASAIRDYLKQIAEYTRKTEENTESIRQQRRIKSTVHPN